MRFLTAKIILMCSLVPSCHNGNNEPVYISDFEYMEAKDIHGIEAYASNNALDLEWENDEKKNFTASQLVIVLGNEEVDIIDSLKITSDTLYLIHKAQKTHSETKTKNKARVSDGLHYFRLRYSIKSMIPLDRYAIVSYPKTQIPLTIDLAE